MSSTERIPVRVSDAELARRWAAARAAMAEGGLDALVMQSNNDWLGGYAKWFTDIPAHNGYPRSVIFYADGAPMTLVDMGPFGGRRDLADRDAIHRGVGELLTTPAFLSIDYTHDYEAELAAGALAARGCRRIGLVGSGAMPSGFVEGLRRRAGDAAFADATEAVDRLKAVKSTEETGLIRACAALQDAVFAKVLEGIRPGMRDREICALAQQAALVLGSEQGIFLGSSAPLGTRSSFLGRHMQGRAIQAGEHFSLLIEVNGPGGFYTEIARTIVLGKASQELRDGFAAVKAAQDHTLSLVRPGASCQAIAAAHDEWMRAHGLPAELRLYAHGQGYDMVERPLIRADETWPLAQDMCLAVHPGYETDAIFAVICDNYMVEADGPSACLHRTQKKIFEL
jgi:Xaa-Pro aminopeptidase